MVRKLSLGLCLAVAACGSAQYIQRTQTGGTIQLDGDRNKAMEQATSYMAQHCGPNNYQVVQEGLEPVGTDTYTRQDTAAAAQQNGNTATGASSTTGVQSTRTATAWRIHYQCGAAGGAAPPPPMGAGAPPPPPAEGGGGAPPPPGY